MDERLADLARASANFGRLFHYNPLLALYGAQAEAVVFTDSNAALVHTRQFGEVLAEELITRAGLRLSGDLQVHRVAALSNAGMLTPNVRAATRIRPAVTSPVTTTAPAANAHGRPGHVRDERSELFLLGVALRDISKDTFYESADARVDRFCILVRDLAVNDPAWLTDFLRWLRAEGSLRTAPLVAAAEFTAARRGMQDSGQLVTTVVDAVLQRADEPGELVA
ncbi:hypothetical protein [Micromonospora profundi]|uniref:hypothetical protein n=1 Tax=Micromonospora profundi TaxID=1420889 RepID=UPI0036C5E28C